MKAEANYGQDAFYTCQIICSNPLSQDTAQQSMNVPNETLEWRQQEYEVHILQTKHGKGYEYQKFYLLGCNDM
jgi:hypothetical protein